MPYTPEGVGYQTTDTSAQAAQDMAPRAPNLREAVMQVIETSGDLTADEIADAMRKPITSIRPRVTELKDAGRLHDTGQRRTNRYGKTAIVWSATPPRT